MLVSLIGAFLQWGAANPEIIVQSTSDLMNKPRTANVQKFQGLADMSQQILKCYHPTARFQTADVIETPWSRQDQYSATKSSLISIQFVGLTNAKYVMQVGLVERNETIKAVVVQETSKIRASAKCELENWTPLAQGARERKPR